MDLISTLIIGAGGFALKKIVSAIAEAEKENTQKQSELDHARIQWEKENCEREAELKRLAKLNDAHIVIQEYKRMLDAAAESERAAYSNWNAAKAHMQKLKEQAQCVRQEIRKRKDELDAHARGKTKRTGRARDENVSEARKILRKLSEFQVSVETSIRSYAQVKKEVWDAMQMRNRQKQDARKRLMETKKAKKFFECASCGKKFAVTVGQLADFHERGFQPPKRCPNCRERRKVCL